MSRHDGKVWVRKLRTGYSTHPWEVRARNHNGYDYYETFYDWADAMVWADELSRTREYVLPRFTSFPTERHIYSRGWLMDREGAEVYLEPEHRVPVALAILAREEKEGTHEHG